MFGYVQAKRSQPRPQGNFKNFLKLLFRLRFVAEISTWERLKLSDKTVNLRGHGRHARCTRQIKHVNLLDAGSSMLMNTLGKANL